MGVSVSTVVEAYERLAAEGLISARAGSGFYVNGPAAPLALAEMEPRLDRAVDPLWVSRQSLETPPGHLKPGCGWLPSDWLYHDGMRRGLRRLALMLVVPLAILLVGGWWWVTGGRWVSTDNAYVHQDIVTLSPDVAGRIVEVAVSENQPVRRGQLLFRLDPRPYEIALQEAEANIAAARLEVEQRRAAYQQALAERTAAARNLDFR